MKDGPVNHSVCMAILSPYLSIGRRWWEISNRWRHAFRAGVVLLTMLLLLLLPGCVSGEDGQRDGVVVVQGARQVVRAQVCARHSLLWYHPLPSPPVTTASETWHQDEDDNEPTKHNIQIKMMINLQNGILRWRWW